MGLIVGALVGIVQPAQAARQLRCTYSIPQSSRFLNVRQEVRSSVLPKELSLVNCARHVVGLAVGVMDGAAVGVLEGAKVGEAEGESEGAIVGDALGVNEGYWLGVLDGAAVGMVLGVPEGDAVGAAVGMLHPAHVTLQFAATYATLH